MMNDDISGQIVYRIINRRTDQAQGVYSRGYHNEYDFVSASNARHSNCHDIYEDRDKYKINKYRVIYVLIEDDVN